MGGVYVGNTFLPPENLDNRLRLAQHKSIGELLFTEGLPSRVIVYFGSQIAKSLPHHNTSLLTTRVVQVAERYGNGENFSKEYLREICDSVAMTAHTTYSSYVASRAIEAAYNISSAPDLVVNAAYSAGKEAYKPLLLKILNERLTKLEKLILFGEEDL